MSATITTYYRYALEGELAGDSVADIRPGAAPDTVEVIVGPGHATQALFDEMGATQAGMFAAGQWYRLPDTPENRLHPRRVLHAGWQLIHPEALPEGRISMSVERRQRHDWLIREGHATPLLVAEMTWLLTRMVRNEVWVQRGAGEEE